MQMRKNQCYLASSSYLTKPLCSYRPEKRLLAGPGGAEIDLKNKSRFALFLRLDATGAAVPIVYQCCYPGWATLALPSPRGGGGFAA